MTAAEGGVYVTWVRNPHVKTGIGEIWGRFIGFDGVLYPEQRLAQDLGFAPRPMYHADSRHVVIVYASADKLYWGKVALDGVIVSPWRVISSGQFDSPNSFFPVLDRAGRAIIAYTYVSSQFAAAGVETDGTLFAQDSANIPVPPAMGPLDARYTVNAMDDGTNIIGVYNAPALGFYRFNISGLHNFEGYPTGIQALGMARGGRTAPARVLFTRNISNGYDFNYAFYDSHSGTFVNHCVPLRRRNFNDGIVPVAEAANLAYAGYFIQEPGGFALHTALFNTPCNSFFDVRMERTSGGVNIPYPNRVIATRKGLGEPVLASTQVSSPPMAQGIFAASDLSDFTILPLADFPSASLIVDVMDNDLAAFLIADADAINGLGNLYVVFEGVIAPTNLKGCKKSNRFLTQTDYYNQLSWTLSSSPQTTGYRIYRNGCLIATVSAATSCYQDHNVCGVNTYEVKGIDAQGNESLPIVIKI